MDPMLSRRLPAVAALLLALGGCAAGSGGSPSSSTAAPTTSSADGDQSAPRATPSEDRTLSPSAPARPSGDGLRPEPEDAFEDQPDAYEEDCQQGEGTEVLTCEYGATDADTTVALVGDSKALQWISAFDEIGRDHDWRIVTMTRSTCTWADAYVSSDQRPDTECWQWGQKTKDELVQMGPDLVATSFGHNMASREPTSTEFSREGLVDGLVSIWDELGDAGIPVAALSDTPNSGEIESIPECVADHRDDPDACTIENSEGIGTPPMRDAVQEVPSATLIDLTDVICPDGTCRPVFGDVLIQRDGSHVTDTFVREVAPALEAPLAELLEPRS